MPLQKLQFKPGVNRENTRYTNEGGWYESDKVRFRQGTPEKIGGWARISATYFLGICRSLWDWVTLDGTALLGVGTNLKFYIERGGVYNDITPIRSTVVLNGPFDTVDTSPIVTVHDTAHGAINGDFVTFSGAAAVGGLTLNAEYQITFVDVDTFRITASSNATSTVNGGGGATVTAAYQLNTGPATNTPLTGWGAGNWGYGTWGVGTASTDALRLWSQMNFGEDLVFGPRGGGLYYFDFSAGITTRAVNVTTMGGASDVPTKQNLILVSDISRFVLVFGCNDLGSSTLDPMLIRWSDQESVVNWTPAITNQAGGLPLSHGSEIITAAQVRQEILVITDEAVYSLQYQGPPFVWGAQLVGDNTTIVGKNAAITASGVVYWMGNSKFYKYDGRVLTQRCDIQKYVFQDLNFLQLGQVFAGTNEGFNEVWWFYCSAASDTIDRYVTYNYAEDVWVYGTMARTAWLDAGTNASPLAATYSLNIVSHEEGLNDNETGTEAPIAASITSAQFDIGDGHNFGFVWRLIPDITFSGSTATSPTATFSMKALKSSGSGYNNPESVGGNSSANVVRTTSVPVEAFTGQIYVRVRGRQMSITVESNQLDTTWQLGAPRMDVRPDGRAG